MKKVALFVCVGISLFALVSASVWEGAAEMSWDLPETGLYIATNSLPINTVVDVTNLENGKFARLIVSSRLDVSGFLALLSRDAANALGIDHGDLTRISLTQNPDPLAFSRFSLDFGPRTEYDEYVLVPDIPRPPEEAPVLPERDQFISSVNPAPVPTVPTTPSSTVYSSSTSTAYSSSTSTAYSSSTSTTYPPSAPTAYSPPAPAANPAPMFSAPVISAMERGMYYVQIAAYANPESVEYEITRRIDSSLPVVIMAVGTEERPVYRIMIGPLTFGESDAVLQRYKGLFHDAFVRQGT